MTHKGTDNNIEHIQTEREKQDPCMHALNSYMYTMSLMYFTHKYNIT